MKFTVDTDAKQIQLDKPMAITDLQDLLKMLGTVLKDIGAYTIAVKQPEKEYIYTPWYVPAQPYVPCDNWKYNEPYKITWTTVDTVDCQTIGSVESSGNTEFVGYNQISSDASFTVCIGTPQ